MTSLVKFLFRSSWAPLEEVLRVDSKDFVAIRNPADAKELQILLSEGSPMLVICSVQSKEDITAVLGFLKTHKKLVKESHIKFAAVNFTNNRQVETALMKAGCQEALDPAMRGKQLKFKLDFWKKALAGVGPKGNDFKMKDMAATAKAEVRPDGVVWGEPLKHVDDMWLTKPADAKRIMGKWLVKFMGPSPMVAQWQDVSGAKGTWRFVFKDGIRDVFQAAEGNWFYQGEQKPEFVWRENLWMITGKLGRLVYRDEGGDTVRFIATSNTLEICKNSTYAQSREKAIIESFDQELMVKKGLISAGDAEAFDKERSSLDALKGKTEGEEALGGDPLSGKGSTDQLGGDPLSGKAATDKLQGDPLKGAFGADQPPEGSMEGRGLVSPVRSGAELSMAADPAAKGGGPMSAPVGQATDGALGGKIGTDDIGATKYKGHLEFDKEEGQSEYGGKSSTDNLGKGHYDGRTEGTPGQPRPETPRHEGSTDNLGKSHYDAPATGAGPTGEMGGGWENPDIVHKQLVEKRGANAAHERKMNQMEELLPEGGAEDPQGDLGPEDRNASSSMGGVVIPIMRDRQVTEDAAADATLTEEAMITAIMRRRGDKALGVTVKVEDFFEGDLITRVKASDFHKGDNVEIAMSFDYMKINKNMQFAGLCTATEDAGDGMIYLTVKLGDQHAKLFEQLLQLYQMRQKNVTQFMKQVKGY